jgi:hypothetical protein
MKPVSNPTHTCDGLWELSRNLAERTRPLARITVTRYQVSGVCIFIESAKTVASKAPAPAECIDIFHQKLIIDTTMATTDVAKMNDFRKKGI